MIILNTINILAMSEASFQVLKPFKKLPHFVKRQKERNISDDLVNYCLQLIENKKVIKNTFLWVDLHTLVKFDDKLKKDLLIRINKKALLTCYFCDDAAYILKEHYPCNIIKV